MASNTPTDEQKDTNPKDDMDEDKREDVTTDEQKDTNPNDDMDKDKQEDV